MKKVEKVINDIHEDLLPKRLERGHVVKYKLLIGKENPDPEARRRRPIIFPASFQIPTMDRIYDSKKDKHEDIAVVQTIGKDNVVVPRAFYVHGNVHGEISLTGGNNADQELYEYMELCNYNESNPNRDTSVEPLFKRVDDQKDAKERSKKRSVLREAMKYVENMTNGEIKDFASGMNWNENEPIEILRDKVEAFADKDPIGFTKVVESKDSEVKVIIKRAIDAGKISYDSQQHRIVMVSSGEPLIVLDRVEGTDYLKQSAEYLMKNPKNGDRILNTIKKLMSTSENS